MTDIQTPDFAANVEVGGFRFETEHALAAILIVTLVLLWAINWTFPTP
jgi:hypothetical protein